MSKTLQDKLQQLHDRLGQVPSPEQFSVLVGFDGFVDEIIEVVDKRSDFQTYDRLQTIADFGTRIQRAAGLSTNIEFVPKTVKLGGNGPIMANAMVGFGSRVSYIGALGYPEINPVFKDFTEQCSKVISIAEPGHTDALEFNDGKVMLGKILSLNDVNWDNLYDTLGEDGIAEMFANVHMVATVNWTMTPYMNGIWDGIQKVVPRAEGEDKPIFFVDLADPEKRKFEDIRDAMDIIASFSPYYRVVLGLNRKEATEVADVLGLKLSGKAADVSLEEITKALAEALDIWCLMVHPTHEAAAVLDGEYAHTVGPYTSKPRLTTGAGDNFNAGFCLGLLLGLSLEDSLMLGKANSGFYVREMRSPSFAELQNFVGRWADKGKSEF